MLLVLFRAIEAYALLWLVSTYPFGLGRSWPPANSLLHHCLLELKATV